MYIHETINNKENKSYFAGIEIKLPVYNPLDIDLIKNLKSSLNLFLTSMHNESENIFFQIRYISKNNKINIILFFKLDYVNNDCLKVFFDDIIHILKLEYKNHDFIPLNEKDFFTYFSFNFDNYDIFEVTRGFDFIGKDIDVYSFENNNNSDDLFLDFLRRKNCMLIFSARPTYIYPWEKLNEDNSEDEIAKGIGKLLCRVKKPYMLKIYICCENSSTVWVSGIVSKVTGGCSYKIHPAYKQEQKDIAIENINNFDFKEWLYNPFDDKNKRMLYLFAKSEIAGLLKFPLGIVRNSAKKITPPDNINDKSGLLIGELKNNLIKINEAAFSQHLYLLGQSGSGKTSTLRSLLLSLAYNNQGFVLIDPHGDIVEDILASIPPNRADDIIYFNPGENIIPINLLEVKTSEEADLIAQELNSMLIKLYGDEIFGPRIQNYSYNAALTLMDNLNNIGTIIDIPRLFTDLMFQKTKISSLNRESVKNFWEYEFKMTNNREKSEMIPYFNAKFAPFLNSKIMSDILGQRKSGIDFENIINTNKILLVKLNRALIGEINAKLLGMIIITKILMAIFKRANMHFSCRTPFTMAVDEFHNFLAGERSISSNANMNLAAIFSEGRKYGLRLMVANQYLAQLPRSIQDAIFGNVANIATFRLGVEDSVLIERMFLPYVNSNDIQNLANYNGYFRTMREGKTEVFSFQSIAGEQYITHSDSQIEQIKSISRSKYGKSKGYNNVYNLFRRESDFKESISNNETLISGKSESNLDICSNIYTGT